MANLKRWGLLLSIVLCTAAHAQLTTGSYVGNGLATQAITTGYRPMFVIVRGPGNWASVVRLANMPAGISKLAANAPLLSLAIVSFEDDGFTVGAHTAVNETGQTFHWAALGPTNAFTLGTYVGDAVDGRQITVGYSPNFVFTFANDPIPVFVTSTMPAGTSFGTGSGSQLSDGINSLTATGFTLGTGAANTSGETYYFLAGISSSTGLSVGTYTGDGVDNRVISTGLAPLWVVVRANGQAAIQRFASMLSDPNSPPLAGLVPALDCIRSLNASSFTIGTENKVNDPGRPYFWFAFGAGVDTTLMQGPGEFSNTTSPDFTFGSNASGATFECRLDGATTFTACANPLMLSGLSAGSHVIEVRAQDGLVSDATPLIHNWTIDLTPPDTSIASGPNAASNDTSPDFDFDCSESNCTFECRLDGAASFTSCADPLALSGLSASAHVLRVRAIDRALNVDTTPLVFNWTIDTTEPITTLDQAPNPASTRPIVLFSSNEAASTFQCSLDSAAYAACASGLQLGPLANSTSHTFAVRAVDAAGNVDSTPVSHTWSIAATLPDTTITGAPATATSSTTATFEFISTSAGTFECSFEGAPFAACTSPTTFDNLASGSHAFAVRAIDALNNVDPTPATHNWTVDPAVGCGCSSANPSSLFALAMLLALSTGRRRRARRAAGICSSPHS